MPTEFRPSFRLRAVRAVGTLLLDQNRPVGPKPSDRGPRKDLVTLNNF